MGTNPNDVLTIGMATRGEFDSVYFTLTGLAANHPKARYLVVDNTPERCVRTEAITRAVGGTYLHRPDLTGTSKPRDAVFRFAETPWVMCVDSHVIFEHYRDRDGRPKSAVQGFLDWLADPANFNSRDMVQGPMASDDGVTVSTHWNQPAPPGLWGEWETTWVDRGGNRFTLRIDHVSQKIETFDVMTARPLGSFPLVHEPALHYGWERLPATAAPMEIPMLGLGCWAMRKDAWPGFNPLFQGFGGEEGYIHRIVKKNGGKTVLLPCLRWRHKFRDVGGFDKNPVPYPLRLSDHVWNLLVGHREAGVEATAQIYDHFGKRIDAADWAGMVEKAAALQPFNGPRPTRPRQTIVGVWYTDNTAPESLMRKSLDRVAAAVRGTLNHDVRIITVGWKPIPGNPFPFAQYEGPPVRSHATLIRQIRLGLARARAGANDAVACLEHDVLYPENYFDRLGDALAAHPEAPVVSNLDYIGLNQTGWLAVKERHEPMHQLCVRFPVMMKNLDRAGLEAEANGSAIVEPDHGGARADWVRIREGGPMPSVHVNHTSGRFTSHGEVCYAADSGGVVNHPYWGQAKEFWPGELAPPVFAAPAPGCGSCAGNNYASIDAWFGAAKAKTDSDFFAHMEKVRELCDGLDAVAEISGWNKPALVAMCASSAKSVTSYAPRQKTDWLRLTQLVGVKLRTVPALPVHVEECDLLFLDTEHTMKTVYAQLSANADKVRRYFVVHTTTIFGEVGDDGSPGVLGAVRKFLHERKEWTSVYHDPRNYGLIVLSRDDRDKKRPPGMIRKGLNFARSLAEHAKDGMRLVPEEVHAARLELCVLCPDRWHDMCGACGCPLADKASWASSRCGRENLNDPAKPVLWDRYEGPDRPGVDILPVAEEVPGSENSLPQPKTGYDMDGVLATGQFRPTAPFVVVSGRLVNELDATLRELAALSLEPEAVYLRTEGGYGDGAAAGRHKADTVKRLGLTEFYEDNPEQADLIRRENPNCRVYLVGN